MIERLKIHRRALHKIPELDYDLPKTREYLLSALAGLPFEIIPVGRASFCAYLDAGKNSTLAFRSDMDALPIKENSAAEYASAHDGKMHACGHDAHMAILLVFAEEISKNAGDIPHNVLLVFQAAEETVGGAKEICESGALGKFGARKIFGLHVSPQTPFGSISCKKGNFMAGTNGVNIDITGRFAHVSEASKGIDALYAGVRLVNAAYEMERNEISPGIFRLLKFGVFNAGTADNIISGKADLRVSLRYYDDETYEYMLKRLFEIARDVDEEFGSVTRLDVLPPCYAVINGEDMYNEFVDILKNRAEKKLDFIEVEEPSLGAEDFSEYQRLLPGLFFRVGIGDTPPLHNDSFDLDEKALVSGVEAFKLILFNAE
jgi:hippurate hydrolase